MGLLAKDFWSFKHYLEAKRNKNGGDSGGLAGTVKTAKVADYHGPSPSKPAKQAERGKGWEIGVKMKGEPAPYKGVGTDPGQKKPEKGGFADEGDKDLIYEPEAGIVDKAGEGGSKKTTWPKSKDVPKPAMVKTKGESFLDKTRGMNLAEFAKHVRTGLVDSTGVVNYEQVRNAAVLAAGNRSAMRALVIEAKKAGGLHRLVAALLDMPETYTEIVSRMSVDPSVSRQIVRAMNDQYMEGVGPPAHTDDDEEEEGEAPDMSGDEPADNIEGEDMPPEEAGEEDDEDEPDLNFDSDTGSGGMTGMVDPKPAHQALADAIGKHKMMAKQMQSYMGSY